MTREEWSQFLVSSKARTERVLKKQIPDVNEDELYWFQFGYMTAMLEVRNALTDLRFNEMMKSYD